MKLDMHCHTHEGSVDSKIGVEEYIRIAMSCQTQMVFNGYAAEHQFPACFQPVNIPAQPITEP